MTAPLLHIETQSELPETADCVVIGAGIVGTSAAYWLARAGMKVVLLEKGRVGAEQSSRNWGWCRQQNRDARELPLSTKSLTLWEEMAEDIGEDLGFRRCGLLYLSDDQAEIDGWARWGTFARGEGVDTRMLSAAEATERGAPARPAETNQRAQRVAALARAPFALGEALAECDVAKTLENALGRGRLGTFGPILTASAMARSVADPRSATGDPDPRHRSGGEHGS